MALVLTEDRTVKQCWQYDGIPSCEQEFLAEIEDKKDPNFVNCYGLSALSMAVKAFQSPELVQKLLDMGADSNLESYIGRFFGRKYSKHPSGSPLHVAAWIGNLKTLKILLDHHANPNAISSNGLTPLLLVLNESSRMEKRPRPFNEDEALDIIKMLIDNGSDVAVAKNRAPQKGANLLHLAAEQGHLYITKYLLSLGSVSVDCRDTEGRTPLMIAASVNHSRIVEQLLVQGADPNHKDTEGYTALHRAAENGDVEITTILLHNDADANYKNNFGRTALHLAATTNYDSEQSNLQLIKCLLDYKADVNAADNYGYRPLHLTILDCKQHVATLNIECLVEHGANPSLRDAIGRVSLSYFTSFDCEDVVRQMSLLSPCYINHNNLKDVFGRPPLLAVVSYFMKRADVLGEAPRICEFEEVVSAFRKSGMDINCQDIGGSTCLHVVAAADVDGAFQYNRSGLIRVLVEFGADLNTKDIDGNSPAHISVEREDYEELELLVSGSWRDSRNLKGETVQSILNRKIVQAERKRTDCGNRQRLNEIVEDVKEMMETLRDGEGGVNVDVVDTLNEKIPEALRASGLSNTMIYPAPMVRILRGRGICCSEDKKLAFTKLLQSINEATITTDSHRQSSEDDMDYELQGPLPIPLLWKQGLLCTVSTHAKTLVWDFVKFKQAGLSVDNYIPPAPDAVKHLIRDMSRACRDNTVGDFHFGEENCGHERCEIGRQVKELVTDLVHVLEELDPRLQCTLHLTGSVREETKLWKPDEFDFMMELTQLKGHCRLVFSGGSSGTNNTMVSLDEEAKQQWQELVVDEEYLSPEKFRNYLVLLTWRAGFSLQRHKYKNLSFDLSQYNGGRDSLPLVRISRVGVLLHVQWHGHEYTSLDVDVDLTPSVPFTDWPDHLLLGPQPDAALFDKKVGYHAITAIKQAGAYWRLSFSLAELNLIRKLSPGWVELYKSLKLLRDIHMKEGATPSYALKSIVLNYVFKENATWRPDDPDELISHVVKLLRRLERGRRLRHEPFALDEIAQNFFTNDSLPDLYALSVSMDWVRLSLLEFCKERLPS